MSALDELADYFRRFPGIGPRQSKRFVYFLLSQGDGQLARLAQLVTELKKEVRLCGECFRYFPAGASRHGGSQHGTQAAAPVCPICADPSRDKQSLMVVSRDTDFEAVEKSRTYRGLYFVLGGSIPLLEKAPEDSIRSRELMARLEKNNLKEVILAMNMTAEGENTEDYLKSLIAPLAERTGLKVSVLGRGLSTGTELEYSDTDTLRNALRNRQ